MECNSHYTICIVDSSLNLQMLQGKKTEEKLGGLPFKKQPYTHHRQSLSRRAFENLINIDKEKSKVKVYTDIPKHTIRSTAKATKENIFSSLRQIYGATDCYQIGREIGRGAYAVVKECTRKQQVSNTYALKVYSKDKLQVPQRRRNVTREMQILKKLDHPHVIHLYETIDAPSHLYLVFEHARGGSLYSHIRSSQNKKLPESEAKRIFIQIADALRYCHRMGVVHRDLKLENILLDDNKDVKLIDFGFSIIAGKSDKLTLFCGTPSYMAPEIASRKGYHGFPIDVWSLGIILHAMLTGKFPFKGDGKKELGGGYKAPSDMSLNAQRLLTKLLSVDPSKRPTCDEVMKDPFVCSGINNKEQFRRLLSIAGKTYNSSILNYRS
eukprot:TRINITY_DN8265_c0_g1_i2.p1 TRINITY_DN8265_c0_g1~~TRINITY_DN8265_c0_g1_i2.p1  ORF type:complete len:382 (+),score=78.88 TRINITY_DN8265_c0_g1_i2:137-1282(+)